LKKLRNSHPILRSKLRLASSTVVSLLEDVHLQDRAHAGRTKQNPAEAGFDCVPASGDQLLMRRRKRSTIRPVATRASVPGSGTSRNAKLMQFPSSHQSEI
jgi:hypothetical protein